MHELTKSNNEDQVIFGDDQEIHMLSNQSVKQSTGKSILDIPKWLRLQIWTLYMLVLHSVALCCIVLYIFHGLPLCFISLVKQ